MNLVQRRLTNAMRGLRQECEASGDALPDCEFVVRVTGGQVEIIAPSPPTPLPQGARGENAEEQTQPVVKSRSAKKRG